MGSGLSCPRSMRRDREHGWTHRPTATPGGHGEPGSEPRPILFPSLQALGVSSHHEVLGCVCLSGTTLAPEGTHLPIRPQAGAEREAWNQSCVSAVSLPLLLAVGGAREEPFAWRGGPWVGGCALREPCPGPCPGFQVLLLFSMLPPMRVYLVGRADLESDQSCLLCPRV